MLNDHRNPGSWNQRSSSDDARGSSNSGSSDNSNGRSKYDKNSNSNDRGSSNSRNSGNERGGSGYWPGNNRPPYVPDDGSSNPDNWFDPDHDVYPDLDHTATPLVPESCCDPSKDQELCSHVPSTTNGLYREGCIVRVEETILGNAAIVGGISILVVLFLIINFIISTYMCCALGKNDVRNSGYYDGGKKQRRRRHGGGGERKHNHGYAPAATGEVF